MSAGLIPLSVVWNTKGKSLVFIMMHCVNSICWCTGTDFFFFLIWYFLLLSVCMSVCHTSVFLAFYEQIAWNIICILQTNIHPRVLITQRHTTPIPFWTWQHLKMWSVVYKVLMHIYNINIYMYINIVPLLECICWHLVGIWTKEHKKLADCLAWCCFLWLIQGHPLLTSVNFNPNMDK